MTKSLHEETILPLLPSSRFPQGSMMFRMEEAHCFHPTKIPQLQTTATVCDTADAKSNTLEGKHGEMLFG